MVVELVRVSDTRGVESFCGGNQGPQRGAVGLSDDVVGNTIASGVPTGGDLTSNGATKLKGLGNEDDCSFLQLGEPLIALARPDIAFIAVLKLEFLGLRVGNFDGFEIVEKLNLLVERFLVGVVAAEELRFCKRM